jgi:hypothetical protein
VVRRACFDSSTRLVCSTLGGSVPPLPRRPVHWLLVSLFSSSISHQLLLTILLEQVSNLDVLAPRCLQHRHRCQRPIVSLPSLLSLLPPFADLAISSTSGGLFRSFETMGQAISYGINSSTGNKFIPLYINAALLVVTIPCSLLVTSWIPTIPSEVDEVEDNTE